jgi:hypothetical protein
VRCEGVGLTLSLTTVRALRSDSEKVEAMAGSAGGSYLENTRLHGFRLGSQCGLEKVQAAKMTRRWSRRAVPTCSYTRPRDHCRSRECLKVLYDAIR